MPAFNGSVYAVAYRGSDVYVGGDFTAAASGGRLYRRQRLAAFDERTGNLLDWKPAADGVVRALAADDNAVFATGDFQHIDGLSRDSLAAFDPVTGEPYAFDHYISGTTYTLAAGDGRLYLGGSFNHVDGATRDGLAAFSLTTGNLDRAWKPSTDDAVRSITTTARSIYIGGAFTTVNNIKGTQRLAALDPATGAPDTRFAPHPPAEILAIAPDPTGVDVALGGQGGTAIAYTPTGAVRWQRAFDGDAVAIASAGGITYVGGHFDRACTDDTINKDGDCIGGSQSRVKLAAVTAAGALAPWAPQANGVIGVRVLSVNPVDGHLYAGGDFTTIAAQPHYRLASF